MPSTTFEEAVLLDPPKTTKVCVKCWAPWEVNLCSDCGCTACWVIPTQASNPPSDDKGTSLQTPENSSHEAI